MTIFSQLFSRLHRIKPLFCLVLLCGLLPAPSGAQTPPLFTGEAAATAWAENPHGRVRLIADSLTVGMGDTVQLGLQFEMQPGWHIYWRNAGDAGYGPKLKWDGTQNLLYGKIQWPAPVRFSFAGIETIGYKDRVVLPITARVENRGLAAIARIHVDYLTCADICVPYQYQFALPLLAGARIMTEHGELLRYYLGQMPTADAAQSQLGIVAVELRGGKKSPQLQVTVVAANGLARPDLFLESPLSIGFGSPVFSSQDSGGEFTVPVLLGDPQSYDQLTQQPMTLTLVDNGRALEQSIVPRIAKPSGVLVLLGILGLALLGGLILNVMPCVLPVLSIKLLQIIGKQDLDRAWVRRGFLASAAGIVFSFWLLALFVFALKQTGMQLGWGIQFQNPYFIGVLLIIVLAFAANMFGLFEIRLPGAVVRIVPLGPAAKPHSLRHEFLLGMFATILATPCSAPFLGTALGFAFAASNPQLFLIFTFIGLGLALPYLVVAVFPGSVRHLPKPGRWMGTVKHIMGAALIVTALWLGGILYTHIAPMVMPKAHSKTELFQWQKFDTAQIPVLLADGKMVFVDITADWCLTCKVNEKLVLESKTIQALLNQPNLVLMRGDWTKADPAIGAYLKTQGRYGIPFNALYSAKYPKGDLLPELLTEGVVADVFARSK
jgi:suppressor for copper-sensitivity B